MKNVSIQVAIAIIFTIRLSAQNHPLWVRYPAISPDGKTIVFSYKGDLYKVASSGGEAIPLTIHEAYDYMPVFSRDGKWLAFASDRYGNFDVYIMPATGGEARRLTYHSATDLPYDFTPDGKYVKSESKQKNSKLHYTTMIFTRGSMVKGAGGYLARAAIIATRYR